MTLRTRLINLELAYKDLKDKFNTALRQRRHLEHALLETRKMLQIKEEEAIFLREANGEMVEAFTLIRQSLVAYSITEAGDPGYSARIEATNRLGRKATMLLKEYIEKDEQYHNQVKAQMTSIIVQWKTRTGCNLMECGRFQYPCDPSTRYADAISRLEKGST
ncbi:hypothetical protein NMY22_g7408 [Coprinellus aureogranulatus]|nr:hypothetical protein NMY22_g7408 [Coprinellus aureogranulatus]